jgi:hypothetical protein
MPRKASAAKAAKGLRVTAIGAKWTLIPKTGYERTFTGTLIAWSSDKRIAVFAVHAKPKEKRAPRRSRS